MAAPVRMKPDLEGRAEPDAEALLVDHRVEHAEATDPAESFHEATKYAPYNLPRTLREYRAYPAWAEAQPFGLVPTKRYPDGVQVALPEPGKARRSLSWVLGRRRSRVAGPVAPDLRETAALLAAGFRADGEGRRPAPSAGGLYPLEVYLVAAGLRGLGDGVWHYDPYGHRLEQVSDRVPDAAAWYLAEGTFGIAAGHLVVSAVLPRLRIKYGARGYRFALQESGHAVQNVLLRAEAEGLSATPVGGFFDDRVHDDLGLDGVDEVALYLVPFGKI